MKRIILFALLAWATSSYGQGATALIVRNLTSCNITVVAYLDDATNPCSPVIATSQFIVPAGGMYPMNNTSYPGYVPGSAGVRFVTATQYWSSLACLVSISQVGDPCTGYPTIDNSRWYNSTCPPVLCGTGKMEWRTTNYPNYAEVLFYP